MDPRVYTAIIPTHIFNESDFSKFMQEKYVLIADFDSELEINLADGNRIANKGFIYELKP